MQKRKFFTLFFALAAMMLASTGQIRADQRDFYSFNQGNNTQSPVTVNCASVSNNDAYLRNNNDITISVSAGYSITNVVFRIYDDVSRTPITATKGSLSNSTPKSDATVYLDEVNSTSTKLSTGGAYKIDEIRVFYKVEEPRGSVDGLTGKNGSFRVWGWALDPDAENSYAVRIHVYLFTSSTETDLGKAIKGIDAGNANIQRDDLASQGHGVMHGFDFNLGITDLNPGTYYVRVFALDKQGISNPNIGYSSGSYNVKAVTVSAPYTVSYNANGGSGAPGSQKKAQDITLKLSTTTPTRTGYTFNGWNTNNSGTGTNYAAGANYTANANVTLYAKWTAVNYTIGYTLNGGSVSGNPTSYTIATNTITLNNPTKDGYTFKGWTGSNGNTPQTNVQIAKGSTGNKTYTANWEKVTYTISYDYAGGSGFNVESYDVETATFQLAAPTRLGYTFVGWTGSNGNTPQMTVQIAKGSTGNRNYTANWAINPNTNVVYLDSLDNTAAQEIVAFNRPEAPEVAGFTFVRWEVVEGPLSEGIKLQAIYTENEPSGAPKKQVGKFTLTRKGDKNEYILQTAK